MIRTEKLGKKYKQYPGNRQRFAEWIAGGRKCFHTPFWALRDINITILKGESVGIIGQNGAGKSTLLKILTGTTKPTEGVVEIHGRVAALLELGLGFHPEFSGRENAKIARKMMGMGNNEIAELLPEIESFSELGDYIDQPLRVYSTGMQMRLAFSTATVICPDILIIDEALSVGDAYFQHKCIQKIRYFKEKGATLLFVSHDAGAVKSLCDRAVLLHKGNVIRDDAPDIVLDYYNGLIAKKQSDEEIKQIETSFGKMETRSGSGKVKIERVEIFDERDVSKRAFCVGDHAKIRCHIRFNSTMVCPTVGILIRDRLGNDVFGTNTYHLETQKLKFQKGDKAIVEFKLQLNLGYAHYSLTVGVHSKDSHLVDNYDWWDQCLVFQIIPNNSFKFRGLVSLPVDVQILEPKND